MWLSTFQTPEPREGQGQRVWSLSGHLHYRVISNAFGHAPWFAKQWKKVFILLFSSATSGKPSLCKHLVFPLSAPDLAQAAMQAAPELPGEPSISHWRRRGNSCLGYMSEQFLFLLQTGPSLWILIFRLSEAST